MEMFSGLGSDEKPIDDIIISSIGFSIIMIV